MAKLPSNNYHSFRFGGKNMSSIRKKLETLCMVWYDRTTVKLSMFLSAVITLMLITVLTMSKMIVAITTLIIIAPFLSIIIVVLIMQVSDITFQKKEEKYLQIIEQYLTTEYVRIQPLEESLETEILENMGVTRWARLQKEGNKEKIIILMKGEDGNIIYGGPKESLDYEGFCKTYRVLTNNPLV